MKKILSILFTVTLVFSLVGCKSITEPLNEHVTKEVNESEQIIVDSIESLKTEIMKEPETIEVEVIIKELEYEVCFVGEGDSKLTLENAKVTKKNFSDIIEIEFDGKYGRDIKPFDTDDVDIECRNTY